MDKMKEHSLVAYLKRQPTPVLEIIWNERNDPEPTDYLRPENYEQLEQILRKRPDSSLYEKYPPLR